MTNEHIAHSGDRVALANDRLDRATDAYNDHLKAHRSFWPHKIFGLPLRLLKSSNAATFRLGDKDQ